MFVTYHNGVYLGFENKPTYIHGKWFPNPAKAETHLTSLLGITLSKGHACEIIVKREVNCTSNSLDTWLVRGTGYHYLHVNEVVIPLQADTYKPELAFNCKQRCNIINGVITLIGEPEPI